MAPRTEEKDLKMNNQQSSINEQDKNNDQNFSLINETKIDGKLEFKLDLKLKNELNTFLNDFISLLLYNDKISKNEKLIERIKNFIYQFADLPIRPYFEDEATIIDDSDIFSDSDDDANRPTLILDSKFRTRILGDDAIRPTLILDSKFRTEILDLLILNKNYCFLDDDVLKDKKIKLDLIDENNYMILKLLKQPIQMIIVNDLILNKETNKVSAPKDLNKEDQLNKYTNKKAGQSNKFNYSAQMNYDYNIQMFNNEIAQLRKEISQLKESSNLMIKESSNLMKKELNFLYTLDTSNFDNGYVYRGPTFNFLDLDWYLKIVYVDKMFEFNLVLMNKLDSIKCVRVNCGLEILNQNIYNDNEKTNLTFDYSYEKVAIFDRIFSNNYLQNNHLHKNNKLIFKFNMEAKRI